MSNGNQPRTRQRRVSTLKLPPGMLERTWETIRRSDVLLRVTMCLLAAVIVWTLSGAWYPPFLYREGDVPTRDVVARVDFETVDLTGTDAARDDAIAKMECVYKHDPQILVELQQALKDSVFQLLSAETFDDVDLKLWNEFSPPPPSDVVKAADAIASKISSAMPPIAAAPGTPPIEFPPLDQVQRAAEFEQFKAAFAKDPKLEAFQNQVAQGMSALNEHGLLESLSHGVGQGNQTRIRVYPLGNPEFMRSFEADKVRLGQATPRLREILESQLHPNVGSKVYLWLSKRMEKTLVLDKHLTQTEADKLRREQQPIMISLRKGDAVLAAAGIPIGTAALEILREEHKKYIEQLGGWRLACFSLSKFGMYVALYVLCGFYIYFRQRPLLNDLTVLGKLLCLVVVTIAISWYAAPSRFELIPLLLFSMTVVIVHQQEMALLLCAAVALVVTLSRGYGVDQLVTSLASMLTAVLLLRHVRSRTKLIYVGIWTAAATYLTAIGVSVVVGEEFDLNLLQSAAWLAGCGVAAGLLMTGLLPFIERCFDVQTDLSLLELGDVAHPLLQELVRRAPGTYNHSINVASIGQAAAEAIGANGLLVRVGAYFHDIGKMLKPQYFVENQTGDNRHESLVPAMSTLVIIAHVKDGADLGRQHNLPESIINFILQHHGTTLVEYFYNRANQQHRESDPEAEKLDEGNYRYPGPKPQTKEAAVLMLADTVESAGRALVDPALARIESLVEEMAMKRLLDGQFDECGLTLKELRIIQDSLIKSLTAVYHGRIKYPEPQLA